MSLKSSEQQEAAPKEELDPNKDFVRLVSSDGFEFIIGKKQAFVSKTIRDILESSGAIYNSNISISLTPC